MIFNNFLDIFKPNTLNVFASNLANSLFNTLLVDQTENTAQNIVANI